MRSGALFVFTNKWRTRLKVREARAGPEKVLRTRQELSAPAIERLKVRLEELLRSRKHLPQSMTGKALSYAINQWGKLGVLLRHGRVQIDNNLIENAIRPSAIGKKNWLFMGDPSTGDRAATFYTLISNCHRQGVNA